MPDDSNPVAVRSLDRLNLRLPAATFAVIDALRVARPGTISRNTWITEAIEEKLARESGDASAGTGRRQAARG